MDKVDQLLTRGVDKIYPSKESLEKVLRSGKKLTLYQGFDPTGDKLHIGHMVGIRKLKQWQDLGHRVIFLIGDGTGQAGDPSGKTTTRDKFMTRDELRENAKSYVMQAQKIVRFDGENPVKILYNGDWLNKLSLVEILDIIGNFSLQQMIERDLFQERIKRGEPVNLREFFYPILQAYDSVAMKVDLELGGSDQTFNMLTGRSLIRAMLGQEKFVMTTPLLSDATGRKIGKSEGNAIAITDEPQELFRKIMGLGDEVIIKAFECLTSVPMDKVKTLEKEMTMNKSPMAIKEELAHQIVLELYDEEIADKAQLHFKKVVQQGELPEDIEIVHISNSKITLEEFLVGNRFATSKSEAKRLIEQGGFSVDEKRISDPNATLENRDGAIIKIGKRKIVKIKIV